MSQSKLPSVVSQNVAAVRSRALPYTNPKLKTVPTALNSTPATSKLGPPGQATTCIAYAFQPSQGQEAILLIPTTAFKFEFREHGGKKVLQFLPPSGPLVPVIKAVKPAATISSATAKPHDGASVQTMLVSSATGDTTVSSASKPTGVTFGIRPPSWNNAPRLDVNGKVVNGIQSNNKIPVAKVLPEREDVDERKRVARTRYHRNHELMNDILNERVVDVEGEAAWLYASRRNQLQRLTMQLQSATKEAERMENAFRQKMDEVDEANALFRYKMARFQQLATLMSSSEFHKATVEAELDQLMSANTPR